MYSWTISGHVLLTPRYPNDLESDTLNQETEEHVASGPGIYPRLLLFKIGKLLQICILSPLKKNVAHDKIRCIQLLMLDMH